MATFTIEKDQADPLLMVLPLQGEVPRAVGADLNASGHGKCCGGCDKPFTIARKQRAVGRVTHFDDAGGRLFTTTWILCGTCAAAIRCNGGRMPAHLVQEARDATSAGLLLAARAEGSA